MTGLPVQMMLDDAHRVMKAAESGAYPPDLTHDLACHVLALADALGRSESVAASRLEDYHRVKLERDGLLSLCVRPGTETDDESAEGQWVGVEEPLQGGGQFWPSKELAEACVLKCAAESLRPKGGGE